MIEHNGVRLEPGRLVERILTVVAFADNLMAFTGIRDFLQDVSPIFAL
jgi:hypothetical protein